jgi:hypothetical protein
MLAAVCAVLASARDVTGQSLGTFTWQLAPYCNVVTVSITQTNAVYTLDGFDTQCGGAGGKAPLVGLAVVDGGTVVLGLTIVTAPGGVPVHVEAALTLPGLGGTWRDSTGGTGTLVFNGPGTGSPRPLPVTGTGGDITSVAAGGGLTGGGSVGDVTLAVNSAVIQSRVTGSCPVGQAVRGVNQNGTVVCESISGAAAGDITGVTAGPGLTGGGSAGDVTLAIAVGGIGSMHVADGSIGAADVNTAQVQRRLSSSCGLGQFLTGVTDLGVPTCSQGASSISSVSLGIRNLESATGGSNTAIGNLALLHNTSGHSNTGIGSNALFHNTDGMANAAVGVIALQQNTTGDMNTAIGTGSMTRNTSGSENTAVGHRSLSTMTDGWANTAIGTEALRDVTTGSNNIAIGRIAGGDITTGSNNIHIGYQGAANESDTIRLGSQQTRAFVRGIRGVTTAGANAVAVLIDSAGQLGTISSSKRTKDDIRDMGQASAGLFRLRPVTFRYIQPYADGSKPLDYGLIAEEVAEVFPDLVVHDGAGEVETVQYHKLVPMLLNELQQLRREQDAQRDFIHELRAAAPSKPRPR